MFRLLIGLFFCDICRSLLLSKIEKEWGICKHSIYSNNDDICCELFYNPSNDRSEFCEMVEKYRTGDGYASGKECDV